MADGWNEPDQYWNSSVGAAFDWDGGSTGLEPGMGYTSELLKSSATPGSDYLSETSGQVKLSAREEEDLKNYLKSLEAVQAVRARQTAIVSLSPRSAIERMLRGQWIPLEPFKSLEDKLSLLQLAIESHDGNILVRVIAFLKNTLREQLFFGQLRQSQVVNHYLKIINKRPGEKCDTLALMGRDEELLAYELGRAVSSTSSESTRVRSLQKCATLAGGGSGTSDPMWRRLISEHITLLERQLPIEQADKMQPTSQDPAVPIRLTGQPLLSTLHYCILHHYTAPETHFHSPRSILVTFRPSEKQYIYTALRALAKSHAWPEIDALFQTKSWYGGTKVKAVIPWRLVVKTLREHAAPRSTLDRYEELARQEDS